MRQHWAGLRRTRRDGQLSLVLRSLASLQSVGYLRALIADRAWVDYHGECATETEFGGENYRIGHVGSVNDVWHDRPSVSAMAFGDQLVGMVWEGHTEAQPPCAYPSRSPRDITCMIVMLRVYILQQIVEVMACRDT